MAYRTFRDAFNYGAREVSAMAWNGSNGIYLGKPGYAPYTSWRNTAAENAMRDFLASHANIPMGARLWTFGTPRHSDADGWSTERGALAAGRGSATLTPERGLLVLLSPPDQVIRPARIDRLIMHYAGKTTPSRVSVFAQRDRTGAWAAIGTATGTDVGLHWPPEWRDRQTIVERLKIEMTFPQDAAQAVLSDLLLYPRTATRTSP
jgi:hypothetical protein